MRVERNVDHCSSGTGIENLGIHTGNREGGGREIHNAPHSVHSAASLQSINKMVWSDVMIMLWPSSLKSLISPDRWRVES